MTVITRAACNEGDIVVEVCSASAERWPRRLHQILPGSGGRVFLFFSNRLGCVGSLAVSAVATLILLLVLGVIDVR